MKNFIKQYILIAILLITVSSNSFGQVFSEDFEGAVILFLNDGGNTTNFGITPDYHKSGIYSMRNSGHGSSEENIAFQTNNMDLTLVSSATLTFWHIAKTEGDYDECYVEVSEDGGTIWTTLPDAVYSGASIDYASVTYFHENSYAAWGTTDVLPDNATWWQEETFDLSSYVGQNDVKIRFRLTTDGITERTGGWIIDDVLVTGTGFNDTDSKILTSAALTEPTTISSLLDTEAEKLNVFDFTFEDMQSGDGLATIIDQLKIIPGSTNDVADWTTTIAGARLDGPDQTSMVGTVNATGITFVANDMISIAEGSGNTETYTLSIWLTTSVTENEILDFKVSNTSVICDFNGSVFGTYSTESGSETITVVATDIGFINQPISVAPNAAMGADVTVGGVDENGSVDVDFSGTISLSSDGTLTGDPISQATVAGVATFSGIVHTVEEDDRTLTATYVTPDPDWVTTSELFNVYLIDCAATDAPDDECAGAPLIDLSQPFAGSTNCSYTPSVGSPTTCGNIENDSWMSFVAGDTDVELEFDIGDCVNDYGVQLAIFSGSCGSLTQIVGSCVNPTGELITGNWAFSGLTIGDTYYIRIDGYANDLCDYWFTPVSGIVVTPPNDLCENAITLTCGSTDIQSTVLATDPDKPTACTGGGTTDKGIWYVFTGDGSSMTISTDYAGTNFDTQINIFTGTCGAFSCVSGDDDGGTGTTSSYTFTAVNGTDYYVYVDGDGVAEGQVETGLTCVASPTPTITTQPTDQTVCAETEAVAFTLTATDVVSYQWQINSAGWTNITNGVPYSNATTNTLNISDATGLIGTDFQCVLTNAEGTTTSTTVTLIDGSPIAPTSVSATLTTITNGESTTLSYIGGSGDTFEWYSGSCGGTSVGTGQDLSVSPSTTTTYYGRWENACGESACLSIEITVNTVLYTVSGALKYDNVATSELQNQTVKLMQGVIEIASATTNASGVYTFDAADGVYTVTPQITLDWIGVSAMDATLYKKHIANVSLLTGLKWRSGDIESATTFPTNPDVNTMDITAIYQRIITQISDFSLLGTGNFANSDGAVTIAGSNETVDIQAICYGDANASYPGPYAKNNGLLSIPVNNEEIIVADNNESFEIPVKLNNTLSNLSSITLEIEYDNQAFEVSQIEMAYNSNEMRYNIKDGKIYIIYSTLNTKNTKSEELLFYILKFRSC